MPELGPLIVEQHEVIEQAFGPDLIKGLYEMMERAIAAERAPIPRVAPPQENSVSDLILPLTMDAPSPKQECSDGSGIRRPAHSRLPEPESGPG